MTDTILMMALKWVYKNLGVGEELNNIKNEVLKSCLWSPLKNKITSLFPSKEGTIEFIDAISDTEATNNIEPYKEIESVYEKITDKEAPEQLWDILVECLKENSEKINKLNEASNCNMSQTIIGKQKIKGDYIQISGNQINTYYPNKKE